MDEQLEEANLLILQKIPTLMELRMLHIILTTPPVNSVYGDAQVKYLQVLEECKEKQKLLDEIAKAELFIKKNETAESEQSKVEKTEAILLKYKPAYGPGGSGPPLPSLRERYIEELEGVKSSHASLVQNSKWWNFLGIQAYEMGKRVETQKKIVEAIIEAEAFVMEYKAKKDHEAREAKMTLKERKAREFKLHKEAKDKEAKLHYQSVLLKEQVKPDRWLENKKKWGVSEAKEAENYKTLVKEMQPIWEQCNDKHSTQIHLAPTVDAKIAIIRDCIRPHLVYKKLISEAEAEPLLLTRYLNEEIRPYFLMGGKKHKHSKTKKSKYVKNKQSRRR